MNLSPEKWNVMVQWFNKHSIARLGLRSTLPQISTPYVMHGSRYMTGPSEEWIIEFNFVNVNEKLLLDFSLRFL